MDDKESISKLIELAKAGDDASLELALTLGMSKGIDLKQKLKENLGLFLGFSLKGATYKQIIDYAIKNMHEYDFNEIIKEGYSMFVGQAKKYPIFQCRIKPVELFDLEEDPTVIIERFIKGCIIQEGIEIEEKSETIECLYQSSCICVLSMDHVSSNKIGYNHLFIVFKIKNECVLFSVDTFDSRSTTMAVLNIPRSKRIILTKFDVKKYQRTWKV